MVKLNCVNDLTPVEAEASVPVRFVPIASVSSPLGSSSGMQPKNTQCSCYQQQPMPGTSTGGYYWGSIMQ